MFWLSLTLVVFWCHSTKGKPFLASGVIVSPRPAVILIADLTFLKPRFKLCSLNVYFKSQTTDVEIKGCLLVYMQFRQLLVCGKNDDHSVSFMFHRKFVSSLKCTTISVLYFINAEYMYGADNSSAVYVGSFIFHIGSDRIVYWSHW